MRSLLNIRILLFLILPLLISCGGNGEESEEQVDQNYIESQEYSDFDQDATREGEIKAKTNASMQARLQQFVECEDVDQMEIPFEVNEQQLIGAFGNIPENCTVENEHQSLKLLGESHFQNQIIRWIVLDRQTAYRDQELLATTFREGDLQSVNTVGVYKKNPSEEILTEVQVQNKNSTIHVTSRTTRNILYPIEQKNIITTEYQIDTDGSIREL